MTNTKYLVCRGKTTTIYCCVNFLYHIILHVSIHVSCNWTYVPLIYFALMENVKENIADANCNRQWMKEAMDYYQPPSDSCQGGFVFTALRSAKIRTLLWRMHGSWILIRISDWPFAEEREFYLIIIHELSLLHSWICKFFSRPVDGSKTRSYLQLANKQDRRKYWSPILPR